MHPLAVALEAAHMTQLELAEQVTALRRRRKNRKLVKLKQNSVSQICAYKRGIGRDIALAIAAVLAGRGVVVNAGDLMLAGHDQDRKAS